MKKYLKQKKLLTEVILPESIQHNLLSTSEIEMEIIIVDGGGDGNPPIQPPEGVHWRCILVRARKYLHVHDKTDPLHGLTFTRVDNALAFI